LSSNFPKEINCQIFKVNGGGIFQLIKTSSSRRQGGRLDDGQINSLSAERKLTGQVPTYIAHAANDPLAPPSAAAHLAEGNPGIEYHEYQDGGHLFFVVQSRVVIPDIERFLLENAPG
jgi:pimeloyl-ACP methyl ester carboxylesterase